MACLLNPGPVNVSERVRKALHGPDICHRESEFSDLLQRIRERLLKAFVPTAESDYTAIVLTGSGSAAVEAAVLSSLPYGKRMLVISNGVYGERIASVIGVHSLGGPEFTLEWGTRPNVEQLRLALRQHPEVHAVAIVHHETTTGLINPVRGVAEVVNSLNRILIVDSVSGLGGEPLDIAGSNITMVAGTAGKCIQAFPGASFVLVRKDFMERMKNYPKRSWYLHLPHYYENEEKGRIPFTPAVQVYYAFDEALNELLEEGVVNRIQRYQRAATLIRQGMSALGLKPLLPTEFYSNTISCYYVPAGLTYQTLHDRLKEQGYVIYAGQGQLENKVFRVANMGDLSERDFEGFLAAFKRVLETEAVRA